MQTGDFAPSSCVLVRVERTDFLQPVYVGEVVEVSAEITFTSSHSLLVEAAAFSENMITGNNNTFICMYVSTLYPTTLVNFVTFSVY